ncbi:MAG: flagellar brake protein [Deltaproteobacteria bacterium]|nr:flagellar brake protein [Deltaproteobacteria bacterium]MBF0527284.1 flagellar brake protein [Deltaproteobacteria bacterium]
MAHIKITDDEAITDTFLVGTQISIQKGMTPEKHAANLVGWIPGNSVLVSIVEGIFVFAGFMKDNPVVVRYINRGTVYGFSAVVQDVMRSLGLIAISWPTPLESLALTSETRIRVHYPVTLTLTTSKGGKVRLEAVLTDLSHKGCQVRLDGKQIKKEQTKEALLVGQLALISLSGANRPIIDQMKAEVRNINPAGNYIMVGMALLDAAPDQAKKLQEVVDCQLQS